MRINLLVNIEVCRLLNRYLKTGRCAMAKVIGIDLGTSNSAAAVVEGGRPVIIPSAEGAGVASGKAFPSYVAFTRDGQRLVGEPAKRQSAINAEGTIQAAKRKMGKSSKSSHCLWLDLQNFLALPLRMNRVQLELIIIRRILS
jgi:molecular chaperone DnaK (HSP70)